MSLRVSGGGSSTPWLGMRLVFISITFLFLSSLILGTYREYTGAQGPFTQGLLSHLQFGLELEDGGPIIGFNLWIKGIRSGLGGLKGGSWPWGVSLGRGAGQSGGSA